jgi:hypothetical protein
MEKFEERLTALENKFGSNDFGKKEKKEKKPRAPSEYNKFVKNFIEESKKKDPTKEYKVLFKEAAESWTKSKK